MRHRDGKIYEIKVLRRTFATFIDTVEAKPKFSREQLEFMSNFASTRQAQVRALLILSKWSTMDNNRRGGTIFSKEPSRKIRGKMKIQEKQAQVYIPHDANLWSLRDRGGPADGNVVAAAVQPDDSGPPMYCRRRRRRAAGGRTLRPPM
jgi:hypothetical protein